MAPQRQDSDEFEDHGVLDAPAVDTTAIGISGTRTAQVSVHLPRGYEDLDDDVVDDDVIDPAGDLPEAPAPFTGGSIVVELPGHGTETGNGTDETAGRHTIHPTGDEEPEVEEPEPEDPEVEEPEADDPVVETSDDAETTGAEASGQQDADISVRPEPDVDGASAQSSAERPDRHEPPAGSAADAVVAEPAPVRETPEDAAEAPTVTASAPAHAPAAALARTPEPAADASAIEEDTTMPESDTPAAQRFVTQPVASARVAGTGAERVEQLTSDRLIDQSRRGRPQPEGHWRGLVYRVTGGLINLGDSRETRERRAVSARIAAPLPGRARFVPVLSRKGGVGKTTVTTLLGMALADARDDRIVAVDANPDRGTLSDRIEARTSRTVRDVVRTHERIHGYADISDLVARDETRLDVIASDTDPQIADAFDADDYRTVADVAAHYYSVVLTDTGTGIVHSVMDATLDLADELVVVAGPSIDEARLASETLTWLEAHGREDLVKNAVVVLNQAAPGRSLVRLDELESHFSSRARAVVTLPYDAALATGSAIVFRDLAPATRRAARDIAAHVVEGMRTAALHSAGAVA